MPVWAFLVLMSAIYEVRVDVRQGARMPTTSMNVFSWLSLALAVVAMFFNWTWR